MTAAAPQKVRVGWVDTGRGIAILLVALYHATNWLLGAGLHVEGWVAASAVLSTLRMPMFFALSGLFAGKWLTAPWKSLWSTKLSLYVWVFFVWEIIGSAVFLLGLTMKGERFGVAHELAAIAVSPIAPRFELWFIWALTLFYLLAKLTARVDYRIQLAVAGAAAFFALSGWQTANVGWSGFVKYYFFFLAGIYLRTLLMRYGNALRWPAIAGSLVVWLALSLAITLFSLQGIPGLYFVNCVMGVFAGIALARAITRLSVLGTLGRQTLPLYLAHTPIIIILAFVLTVPALRPLSTAAESVLPPILAGAALALAYLLHLGLARTPARYLYEQPHLSLRSLRIPFRRKALR